VVLFLEHFKGSETSAVNRASGAVNRQFLPPLELFLGLCLSIFDLLGFLWPILGYFCGFALFALKIDDIN
jgi:hypothetical protein